MAAKNMDMEDVRVQFDFKKNLKICGAQMWKRREAKVTEKLAAKMEENVGLQILVRKAKGFARREGAQAGTEKAEVEGT